MSEFSELLSHYIHKKNISVYALAQYCGMDRSSLYKIIRGKRTPSSISIVDKFADYIHLNPLERKELLEFYHITSIGADNYYRRKDVLNFITGFADVSRDIHVDLTFPSVHSYSENTVPLDGKFEVTQALISILFQESKLENGRIHLLIQPEHKTLMDLLVYIGKNNNKLSIEHIICLNNTEQITASKKDYNLHCLQHIIPLYACSCQYEAFYYYDNIVTRSNMFQLFPYIVLTRDYALLLSENMDKGTLYHAKEIVRFYADIFSDYRNNAKPLISKVNNIFSLLQATQNILKTYSGTDYSFQMQPCLTPILPFSYLEKYVIGDTADQEIIYPELQKHLAFLTEKYSRSNSVFIFSEEGIQIFLDTGRLVEYPDDIYTPMSREDCISLIRKIIDADCSYIHYKMLRQTVGNTLYGANMYVNQVAGYILFRHPETSDLIFLNIEESSLLFAFRDFFEHMDSDLFYSDEEMKERLKHLIRQKQP